MSRVTKPADLAEQLKERHAGMVFVADDPGAWLIFILAEAGRKKAFIVVMPVSYRFRIDFVWLWTVARRTGAHGSIVTGTPEVH